MLLTFVSLTGGEAVYCGFQSSFNSWGVDPRPRTIPWLVQNWECRSSFYFYKCLKVNLEIPSLLLFFPVPFLAVKILCPGSSNSGTANPSESKGYTKWSKSWDEVLGRTSAHRRRSESDRPGLSQAQLPFHTSPLPSCRRFFSRFLGLFCLLGRYSYRS